MCIPAHLGYHMGNNDSELNACKSKCNTRVDHTQIENNIRMTDEILRLIARELGG